MIRDVNPFVHDFLENVVSKSDYTVDATCGNGRDTLFLAKLSKHVYSFDIQDLAIRNTKSLIDENNINNVTLIKETHQNMSKYIKNEIKAITFNLGYLPGGDKSIITNENSTVPALQNAIKLLAKNGVITIILYVGHIGGLSEAKAVEEFASALNKNEFKVIKYSFLNTHLPPYVIVIEKQ
jgi:SAM-dependent methyltransferase